MKKPHILAALLLVIGLLGLGSFQSRQDPMASQILNAVGQRYKKLTGFKAVFSHESQTNSGQVKGTVTGNITVSGKKYRLQTGTSTLICDGKNVWSADSKVKEVNLSDYEPEPDDITPEKVYTFYQTGYKYMFMGEVKTKTGIWQTIDLEPENIQKEVSKIRLFVDKKTLAITKWIVFERGTNDREEFVITKFEALKQVNPADFTYSKSQFPGYKLVDLR